MPMLFIKFWKIVGDDVVDCVLNFLNFRVMPKGLNHTFITLIPKIKVLKSMKDLHPISLCNMVYKFMSKTLDNRLKMVLPSLIHKSQKCLCAQQFNN